MRVREEDEADRWLREHDPYYTGKKRNKVKECKYPYDTPKQEKRKSSMEIAFSNLSNKQKLQIPEATKAYEYK